MTDLTPNAPSTAAQTYDAADDEIDLWELWDTLWSNRWIIIGISFFFGVAGATYSLLATPVFESKVVLSPVQKGAGSSSLLAQLGPAAALGGVGGVSQALQVPLATLQSVQFVEDFITQQKLMPVLLKDFRSTDGEPPDIRDAITTFKTKVLSVTDDKKTGLVTMSVKWEDPVVAAKWANQLAEMGNETLRNRALKEAERNVAYLQSQLPTATSVSVQQSIGRLLDQELQTVMLAKGNPEYAFKVIDPGKVAKQRTSPKRTLITLVALMAGGFLGVLFVFIRKAVRARRETLAVAQRSTNS